MRDHVTIRETFDALFRAVTEERNVDAFVALWADDVGVTLWGSDLAQRDHGIEQIRVHGEVIAGSDHELRFYWDDVDVYERGEVAWVNAHGRVSIDGAEQPYRLTAVLIRAAGGWRWHTFNGSLPD
jgi:ketosteroid isomerase-like protein